MSQEREILYAGHYLQLAVRDGWEYATRHHPVVVAIAWTPADELLLVEQFRIPVGRRTIELPAGLVGDDAAHGDESLLMAAARELEEETGWRAGRVEEVMRCPTSPGMTDEVAVFVRADDLVRVSDGGGDESEDIIVHAIRRDRVDAWLAERDREGLAIDPKIWFALRP